MNFKKYHVSRNLLEYYMSASPYIGTSIGSDGAIGGSNSYRVWVAKVTTGETYTISGQADVYAYYASEPIANETVAVDGTRHFVSSGSVITIPNGTSYIGVRTKIDEVAMLNTGSQPLPYEPYSSEVWHDIPHYIHKTDTDTITTLPADVYANDTTATVGLKGQMEQSSTPSPTTPIQPQETGERTGNLFDSDILLEAVGWEKHDNIYSGYSSALHNKFNSFDKCIPVDAAVVNIKVMFKYENLNTALFVVFWYTDGTSTQNSKNGKSGEWTVLSGQSASNKTLKGIAFSYGTNDLVELKEIMLNTGSQSLPYEPWGVKIPILSGGVTTPVYLGEVETTRQIKKIVLDGTEGWQESGVVSGRIVGQLPISTPYTEDFNTPAECIMCSHIVPMLPYPSDVLNRVAMNRYQDGMMYISLTDEIIGGHSFTNFTTYLAAQYAAGTPVCVWYVQNIPTTGIVNEPLRKIGDYADEVSGITIPTIAGANTLSIGTTLQPSEVSVNYKGWHPVADVHERESGQWD